MLKEDDSTVESMSAACVRDYMQVYAQEYGFRVGYAWVKLGDPEKIKKLHEIYGIFLRDEIGGGRYQNVRYADFNHESCNVLANVTRATVNDPKVVCGTELYGFVIGFLNAVRAEYLLWRRHGLLTKIFAPGGMSESYQVQ